MDEIKNKVVSTAIIVLIERLQSLRLFGTYNKRNAHAYKAEAEELDKAIETIFKYFSIDISEYQLETYKEVTNGSMHK